MTIIEHIGIAFSIVAFAFSIFGWGYLLGAKSSASVPPAGIRSMLRKSHAQARRR